MGGGGAPPPAARVDFLLRRDLRLGLSFPSDGLVLDLDRDGLTDLVGAEFLPHGLLVARGEPGGDFTPVAELATLGAPWQLAAGDVDGDGRLDLVAACLDEQGTARAGVELFLQDPAGGFAAAAARELPFQPLDVALGPESGRAADRGPLEILVADRDGGRVLRLRLDAALGLTEAGTLPADAGGAAGHPISLALLDVGRDGWLDLLAGEIRVAGGGADRVVLHERTPLGYLPPRVLHSPAFGPLVQAVGDVDRDGSADLGVAQLGSTRALLLRGEGTGFAPALGIELEGTSSGLAFDDFDGDGALDVAAAVLDRDTLAVRLASSPLVWGELTRYDAGFAPRGLSAAFLPGDGLPDLVCANASDFSVLPGTGEGSFRSARGYPTLSRGPITVRTADLDLDGDQDAVCMTALQTSVVFLEGDGEGGLLTRSVVPLVQSPTENYGHVAIADLDGDELPEVAATVLQTDELRVFRNTGTIAGFAQAAAADTYRVGSRPTGLDLADLDGDGRRDAVVGNAGDRSVQVLLGVGQGRFQARPALPVEERPGEIRCGDLDADGDVDVVLTTGGEGTAAELLVLAGDGTGALEARRWFSLDSLSASLEVADLDHDLALDLVVGQPGVEAGEVYVLLNRGGLDFEGRSFDAGPDPEVVLVDDFDRDGHPDVLVISGTNDMHLARGDGRGGFPTVEPMGGELALPFRTQAASSADFDGDGLGDLALVAAELPLVWVARNESLFPPGR